jgi:hypothetical protein
MWPCTGSHFPLAARVRHPLLMFRYDIAGYGIGLRCTRMFMLIDRRFFVNLKLPKLYTMKFCQSPTQELTRIICVIAKNMPLYCLFILAMTGHLRAADVPLPSGFRHCGLWIIPITTHSCILRKGWKRKARAIFMLKSTIAQNSTGIPPSPKR